MKTLLAILCLLPTLCFGQGFGSFKDDQPFLAKDVSSGGGETYPIATNLAFYWDCNDLTNSPITTVWVDRIQGNVIVATNSPTWATNSGVTLNGNNNGFFITNYVTIGPGTSFMLLSRSTAASGQQILLSQTPNATFIDINTTIHVWRIEGGNLWPEAPFYGPTIEFVWTGKSTVNESIYTNGVDSLFGYGASGDLNAIGAGYNTGNLIAALNGQLYAFMVWTNATELTPAQVAEVHNYVTNHFSYAFP